MAEKYIIEKGYAYFRLFVNLIVFVCLLVLLFFVELRSIKLQIGIIPGLVPVLLISALLLIFGLLTLFPQYDKFVGVTLIIFGSIIFTHNLTDYLRSGISSFNLAIEFLMSIVLFMYGLDLRLKKGSFVSLSILADRFR